MSIATVSLCRYSTLNLAQQQGNVTNLFSGNDGIKPAKECLEKLRETSIKLIGEISGKNKMIPDKQVETVLVSDEGAQHYLPVFSLPKNNKITDEGNLLGVVALNLAGAFRLEPKRCKICPQCKKHFYQLGRVSQQYCSTSCSDKTRNLRRAKDD